MAGPGLIIGRGYGGAEVGSIDVVFACTHQFGKRKVVGWALEEGGWHGELLVNSVMKRSCMHQHQSLGSLNLDAADSIDGGKEWECQSVGSDQFSMVDS